MTIAWGTLGRGLTIYARIPSCYHFDSLRMCKGAPGDDDTVVGLAGGDGDGREKQTRRRGKCGRQLPKSGWAGRTPAKRPALVAPDRHRRSPCPRRRLSPRRACDLSVPGDNSISLLSHFSELIPTVRISAADNPLKQESASTKLFIEDRVRLNTFSDARPSPPLQEQLRGDLDILPARGEMSICSTPSCFPRKPSESGHFAALFDPDHPLGSSCLRDACSRSVDFCLADDLDLRDRRGAKRRRRLLPIPTR